MAYEILADVYDALMQEDVDYNEWSDYCIGLFEKHGLKGKRILDLGCGTGNITIPFSKKGYKMTGVDISAKMLMQAEQKARAENVDLLLLCEDITQLDLGDEKFDGALATFDTINYITEPQDLLQMLKNLHQILEDNGIFVFDINTEYKLQEILGDHIYTYYSDDVVYIWENEFDEEQQICYMDLTFFIKEKDLYRRYEENHAERVYAVEVLAEMLEDANFIFMGVYVPFSYEIAEDIEEEERLFLVAKKA